MSALFPDTHPKMEALQIELWRTASPTRKMNMLAQLNQSARLFALAGLQSQYPQAGEAELRRRLTGLLLGEEIARAGRRALSESGKPCSNEQQQQWDSASMRRIGKETQAHRHAFRKTLPPLSGIPGLSCAERVGKETGV